MRVEMRQIRQISQKWVSYGVLGGINFYTLWQIASILDTKGNFESNHISPGEKCTSTTWSFSRINSQTNLKIEGKWLNDFHCCRSIDISNVVLIK